MPQSKEIFSFHLLSLPLWRMPGFLYRRAAKLGVPGLKHAESFFAMGLGEPVFSLRRYILNRVALFAWWEEERFLEQFLDCPENRSVKAGWHVRMRLYRRWGKVSELDAAMIDPALAEPEKPVVAVTLARLRISQARRFVLWGKPVERQVLRHPGKTLALAAFRPLNTFSTFSVWRNEVEMVDMVHGSNAARDGESHKLAMSERSRRDFHHEFTTLRFVPFRETGSWNGESNFTC